jgi:hypothetical protein
VDYEQIAKYGGYTKGSAAVLYRKALRKLTDAYPIEGDVVSGASASDNAGNDPVTPSAKAKTPKTPRSRATGRKRKDVGEEADSITPSGGPQTPFGPGNDVALDVGCLAMETPTKKPKTAAGKQATSYVFPSCFLLVSNLFILTQVFANSLAIRSFTAVNAADDDYFLKDESLFEPVIKIE